MIGKTLGHYQITSQLGKGGMGEVYRAKDQILGRDVAIKVLPEEFARDTERIARFQREAKVLASLNHPNIAAIHGLEQSDGKNYLVLELVEGQTLADRIKAGPVPVEESLKLALQIAEALEAAHEKGVIHRDLKPANIKVTPSDKVKVLDFGLAKQVPTQALSQADTQSWMTRDHSTAGTLAYMSPEQLGGQEVDTRSDIFSFGIVLYEMLAGIRPFKGETGIETGNAILNLSPRPLSQYVNHLPASLENLINKMLAKPAVQRYQAIDEVREKLVQCQAGLIPPPSLSSQLRVLRRTIIRPRIFLPLILIALATITLGYWYYRYSVSRAWARKEALSEITRLVKNEEFVTAFYIAEKAEKYTPQSLALSQLWPQISREISVETVPPGASIYAKEYGNLAGDWRYLGLSPLKKVRMPLLGYRWRSEKEGFAPLEIADGYMRTGFNPASATKLNFRLDRVGSIPPEMVRVPSRPLFVWAGDLRLNLSSLPSFLIDRFEVTNGQFKRFVDAGGYQDGRYWKHEYVKNGRVISRQEVVSKFRDSTGRPGPATWSFGTYPDGQSELPVGGVSWYEAAAYAEFAGKVLPTVYHWYQAADEFFAPNSVPLSNIGGNALAPVGKYQGMSPCGAYDMFGNIREWCLNAHNDRRFILGGSSEDIPYMSYFYRDLDPFDRSPSNGFRCMKYEDQNPKMANLGGPIKVDTRNYDSEKPVDDKTFKIYKSLFKYDRSELNASSAFREDSQHWTREKVVFDAAYRGEQVPAFLFLPKNGIKPYQVVIYFPGSTPFEIKTKSDNLQPDDLIVPIIRSGRAVLWPIYKGSFERMPSADRSWGSKGFRDDSIAYRDELILDAKDLARSIDFLETRTDLSHEKIAYCGVSYGAMFGSVFLAIENRIKTGLFLFGGLLIFRTQPEIDTINFVTRVTQPVLMVNGRYDPIFSLEGNQIPQFRLMGTREKDKKLVLSDLGHGGRLSNVEIREILEWLDLYLGPVMMR
ncbi:MAG: serine/threonine protein kinase [Deltaproteobacteria bacterium]|nr:serine/threonine protein kinase [Deltaproteobacteria bacterium]